MSWKDLDLWQWLKADADEDLRDLTRKCLVLASKQADDTKLDDFTLHDSGHAARVAARMWDLMGPEARNGLYPEERALLLLSAYLHDIGMSPNHGVVRDLHKHLLEGGHPPEGEAAPLRAWLDTQGEPVVPLPERDGASRFDRAALLVTHYCRSRHTAWSSDWITANIPDDETRPGFRAALIDLCLSHHWGWDRVMELKPCPLSGGRVANLRYLAVLLRVADVLEISPERVPPVIRDHRAISAGSRTYWAKDLVSAVSCADGEIRLTATPDSARLHHAIMQTIEQIDLELRQAHHHADMKHLVTDIRAGAERYAWPWPPKVIEDIHPRGDYVYINGSFRPDVPKMLSILAGTALYGDPFAAIRELLQNAFDAVRWRIAEIVCDRLAEGTGQTVATLRADQARAHHVTLTVKAEGDRL
ncbi:hypothetical protein MTBLM5_20209 [Magnetospirillum sp. LM-5]|uniref:HD domain-containing protein n=1 Tax=Magnetospirillum sp. LM-5 TaxID=2681466 RepID=UPI001381AF6D|nr:hypothetical protein [Magnetospirillum sp. LM-5]CAA7616742.1 hypothetical protein MTBLM5_20209 [Magnetospirillum sp. LM-5]